MSDARLLGRERAQQPGRTLVIFVSCCVLTLVAALILMRSMGRGINHDEHQFVASGALLARQGLLPYRDYPYFHVPNLTFLYGLIFRFTPGAYLVAARTFSAVCAFILVAIIFLLPFQLFRDRSLWVRLALGACGVGLLIFSPMFTYTSGRAWNHDLPVLLAVAAFLLHVHGVGRKRAAPWLFLSGLAIGAAAFTRLSFILLFLPFAAYLLLASEQVVRQRLVWLGWFALGIGVVAIPTAYTAALAPAAFFFDNVEYVRLNTLFRAATGYQTTMTLGGKLNVLIVQWLLLRPGNLIPVLIFAVCTLPHSLQRQSRRVHPEHPFLLLILLSLFVGALAPTPSWSQYYYALFPFLVIGALYGLRDFHTAWLGRKLFWGIALATLCFSAIFSIDEYRHIRDLFRPDEWFAIKVQEVGADVKRLVGDGERVLTNAPIYPLEGGVEIYPEFATGPFAMRVASLLSQEQQQKYGFVAPERMESQLAGAPPRAVLIEVELSEEGDPAAEQEVAPLEEYSARHAYSPFALNDELTLWLRPLVEWDENVRLLHYEFPERRSAPGATLPLMLFLDSRRPISSNLNIIVRVVDSRGVDVARSEGWPWGRPTSAWQPGEVWFDGHEIALPDELAQGVYRVEVGFYDPQAGAPLPITAVNSGKQINEWWLLDTLHVASIDSQQQSAPEMARFGAAIDLLNANLSTVDRAAPSAEIIAHPGDTLALDLIWRAHERIGLDYTLFLHLLDAEGNLVAQWDRQPLNGFVPTSMWRAGDTFVDSNELRIPEELPSGDYLIRAGMYNLDTLDRLPVHVNGQTIGDALDVVTVTVE